jgi:hypothetical protein
MPRFVIPALAVSVLVGLSGCTSAPTQGAKPSLKAETPVPTERATLTPTPTSEPSPSPAIPTTPTPYPRLPIPAGTPRCHTAQLEIVFIQANGATGHVLNDFEIRNRSGTPCWVYGYVGFQLLDSAGRPRPQTLVWTTDTFFIRFDPPSRIFLPTGTAPVHSSQLQGHAFFSVEADDSTCSADQMNATAKLEIWPPDEYQAVVIPTKPGWEGFVSCGYLAVHPLQVQPGPASG